MSAKKKNPLKGLDDFLKQEASSLVTPDRVGDNAEEAPQTAKPAKKRVAKRPGPSKTTPGKKTATAAESVSKAAIEQMLAAYRDQQKDAFATDFYDIVLKTAESLAVNNPKNNLLINTILYIKGGDEWKKSVSEYWKKQP